MRNDFLKGLNPSQSEAVTHGEGPLLVLAGPGSGKTRVISHRIAYLVSDLGVPPYQILAVTFTNKAAREMKTRTEELAGERAKSIWIGTFHSICLRILKQDAEFLDGYTKDFVVYDQGDQLSLIKSCMKDLDYGENLFTPKKALFEFDMVENRPGGLFRDDFLGRNLKSFYDFYKKELVRRNAMTFNDLLHAANRLLSENEEVRRRYQEIFCHVLVDEYQDTNPAQYMFAKTVSEPQGNLFVVGDDGQSIYGWRGADIDNILNFERDFGGAKVVKLERNYRSTSSILGVANSVMSRNRRKKEKKLWTESAEGQKPVVFEAESGADEALFVAQQVRKLVGSGDFSRDDIAVFYRANFQSRIIEEVFRAEGVPYRILSGVGFYQRSEVKDVISYLRLVQNPRDGVSFERVVNVPPRRIGGVTMRRLRDISESEGITLFEAVERCRERELLPERTLQALEKFSRVIGYLRSEAEALPAAAVVESLLDRTRYMEHLKEETERAENVKELLNTAESRGDISLAEFLDGVLLSTDEDRQDSGGQRVSLMTVHASKGLEFPAVFVVGMNHYLFPHRRSVEERPEDGLEEERRLFYVAVTRAERLLYLSYAGEASRGDMHFGRKSIFLDELPRGSVVCEFRPRKDLSGGDSRRSSSSPLEKAAQRSGRPGGKFRPGQKVEHKVFGPGVVTRVTGKGRGCVATVDFFGAGVKRIAADFLSPR